MAWHAIAAVAGIGLNIWGSRKQAKAAGKQAELQNEAVQRQHDYNLEAYEMKSDQLRSEHAYRVETTRLKRQNDATAAEYRDNINNANYAQQLMIRNREQDSLDAQFERSNQLYLMKKGYNELSADKAIRDESRKLDEINTEAAFSAQEQRIKHLQQEGEIRALGQSGRSISKSHQAAAADFGIQVAILNEGLASAGRNHWAALEEIKYDKFSADLAAWAEKMQDPGELPMPIVPIPAPRTVYQDVEELQDFHFGPEPVKGAMVSVSAAKSAVWGSAIPSIVNTGINAWGTFKN